MTVTPPDLFQVEPNGLRSSRDIGKALPPGEIGAVVINKDEFIIYGKGGIEHLSEMVE